MEGHDGNRIESCVLGAVDGHGSHGYAGRHLDDGQEGVQSVQGFGFNRDADDGERCIGRDDPGQMCSPAGSGDDDLASLFGQ